MSTAVPDRLAVARAALARATERTTGRPIRAEPVTDDEAILPVTPVLRRLLPHAGLRRGSAVVVRSSPGLLLAVLSEASTAGSWCALVGMPNLGLLAAHEAGLDLARTAVVPAPGDQLVAVLAALLEGVELVAFTGGASLRAGDRQRLAARARERGAVLVSADPWPGADLVLSTRGGRWRGLVGDGMGRLRARDVRVGVTGKGLPQRGREAMVVLPDPSGRVACSEGADRTHPARPALYRAG